MNGDPYSLEEILKYVARRNKSDDLVTERQDDVRREVEPEWDEIADRREVRAMVGNHPPLTDKIIAEVNRLTGRDADGNALDSDVTV